VRMTCWIKKLLISSYLNWVSLMQVVGTDIGQ